jgi:hypothetical protein
MVSYSCRYSWWSTIEVLNQYAIEYFGSRVLSRSLNYVQAKYGAHILQLRLDCDLEVPVLRDLLRGRYDPK